MSFEAYIARRYLFSRKKSGFITIITSISILGVTVGVAALIVVLSVFNGFSGLVTSLLIGFDPHLRIEGTVSEDKEVLENLTSVLDKDSRIKAYSPFVSGKGMILSESASKAVFITGVDERGSSRVSGLEERIVLGKLSLRDTNGIGEIVLGITLSDRLGVIVGDTVVLVSPAGIEATIIQLAQPEMLRFRVAGIYQSHNREYDGLYAYISLASAQSLFNKPGIYSGIEMRLKEIEDAEAVKRDLQRKLPAGLEIYTWYDLHKDLYSIMTVERWIAYIILCLIIGVATFNLLGSLTMSVIEKTREIGALKSMGSTNRSIVHIYLIQGLVVGLIGTGLGSLVGFILCQLQEHYHLFRLDPTVYIISAIPVEVRWIDFIVVGLAAIVLCSVAALYPARRAAALQPAQAVRWE